MVTVVEEEVVQGGWDAAPARAMMAALAEREREREVVEGEEEDGMRARRRRNRQGGRQSRRCWASPCIWVRVCEGRFIVALPSETEWRDPCSHLRASHHRTQNPTALDVWMHVHAREHGSAARATPHAEPSPHSSNSCR